MRSVPSTSSLPICLDLASECLWRGAQAIPLRPKTFAVLRYLLDHPGQLVTKATLLDAVWPDITIGDGGLMVCMHELRRALGDNPKAPRFIETLPRRGYRLIGHIAVMHLPPSRRPQSAASSPVAPVGREAEMAYLYERLERALSGARQVVLVTGEAGLGKTTLVDAFVEAVGRHRRLCVGRGQCIEHYGAGEAYMPVLEAFGGLCRDPGGQELVRCLAQHAPTWLVQMPGLVSTADLEALQRQVMGTTRERMLRELAAAIEVLTDAQPLVLVLEDLHWSDYSTLDLLAVLGRRREPARLLVLGTYRPEDVAREGHPLKTVLHELHIHGRCDTLPLTFLTEAAIAAYLIGRFPGLSLAQKLARFVFQRTDGNPLFMINVVETWLAQGVLVEQDGQWTIPAAFEALSPGVPESLQQMIAQRLERLGAEDQRVVEAASVAGMEFSAAAVAAALAQEVAWVEVHCAHLARQGQLLRSSAERAWPDGTEATCYSFIHALYQEVVYNRLPAAQRIYLHRRIGAGLEAGYGVQAGDIAAELAMHFERGRDARRAVSYLRQAADTAVRRYANAEAAHHLSTGLALLQALPPTAERTQQELALQCALGASLMAVKGFAAPEVERAYGRAQALCEQVGESPQLGLVLWGLLQFYMVRTELQMAQKLGERLINLAQSLHDLDLLLAAHNGLGTILSYRGELPAAHAHLEQSITLYDPQKHHSRAFFYGTNLKVDSLAHGAHVLWLLGYPEQAKRRGQEALVLAYAQEPLHPYTLAHALNLVAVVHHLCREELLAEERAQAGRRFADEHGFAMELGRGTILQGWTLVIQGQREEGLVQMRQGLTAYRATGAEVWRPFYLALLGEAYVKAEQMVEAPRLVTEALALAHEIGGHWWEAELHRLKGELFLSMGEGERGGPEESFHRALDVARRQQAKSLELRAAMSLSRLWQRQGKGNIDRQLLAEIYGWFTEGFDTADLQEARALLDELS
jgi:predicted ATPase/DNA-binding winged helix-turn-helix (wHTH) protein